MSSPSTSRGPAPGQVRTPTSSHEPVASSSGALSVTRAGRWMLGVATVLTMVGLLRGDVWMYLVALLAVSALVVDGLAVARIPAVSVTVRSPEVEIVGLPTRVLVVLRAGASRVPRHRLSVHAYGDAPSRDASGLPRGIHGVVGPLAPGESAALGVLLGPEIRGVHDRSLVVLRTNAPFGLVRRTRRYSRTAPRVIAAGIAAGRVEPVALGGAGHGGPLRLGRTGTDLHALRAWAPGDGTAIHWRTTARRGVPVVAEREEAVRTALTVVVGPARDASGADAVVARAAGIALAAAREGAEVRMLSLGEARTVQAQDEDALLRWTVAAQPVVPDAATVEHAVAVTGGGGRLAVVHERGSAIGAWTDLVARHGAEVVDVPVDPRPVPDDVDPVPPELDRALALATMGSVVGGLLALTLTDVIGGPVALVAWVVLGLAACVPLIGPTARADRALRTGASLAVVAVTAILAIRLADGDRPAVAAAAAVCGVAVAQLLGARTRRDGLVALSLGPVMVVLAAGFAPGPALALPTVVVAVAALAGLAGASRAELRDGTPAVDVSPGPLPWVAIAGATAVGLVSFLVLPLGSAPTLGPSLLGDHQRDPGAQQTAAQEPPPYFAGAMDLSERGHLPDTPAFAVAPGAPTLWRALTLDQATDGTWHAAAADQTTSYTAQGGRVPVPTDPAEAGAPARSARTFDVRPVDTSAVLAPGPPTTISGVGSVVALAPHSYVLNGPPVPYSVTAVPREDIDALSAAGTGPDRTEPVFVTPDPTVGVRTSSLAESIVAGTTDRVRTVQAVEDWLRTHVRYQLDAPVPPEGQDAVDYLLFDSKAGFCEHFAAAETTLLRILRIPSRVVTGYAVTGQVLDENGWLVARDSDAHAWVEVWVPGHGWVSSDPTRGAVQAETSTGADPVARVRAAWNSAWASDSGRRGLAAFVVLVLALAGAAFAGRGLRRRRRGGPTRGSASSRPATVEPLPAFARYRAALAAAGHHQAPGDGVAQARREAGDDLELLRALDVVERSLYDRIAPSSQDRLAAADHLDRVTGRMHVVAVGGRG